MFLVLVVAVVAFVFVVKAINMQNRKILFKYYNYVGFTDVSRRLLPPPPLPQPPPPLPPPPLVQNTRLALLAGVWVCIKDGH